MFLLLAEGLTAGTAQPEEDEHIEVKSYAPNELKRMLQKGLLHDAKTVSGLLYYLTFLKKSKR
jgi:ADP-ribose pyrophosphatase